MTHSLIEDFRQGIDTEMSLRYAKGVEDFLLEKYYSGKRKHLERMTEDQLFFGFIQPADSSMVLSVLLSSGWFLKYSLCIEDVIQADFIRYLM